MLLCSLHILGYTDCHTHMHLLNTNTNTRSVKQTKSIEQHFTCLVYYKPDYDISLVYMTSYYFFLKKFRRGKLLEGQEEEIKKKGRVTHSSGGVTPAIESSMSTLPRPTGENSRDPRMSQHKDRGQEDNAEQT